jgi:hypothetical protein
MSSWPLNSGIGFCGLLCLWLASATQAAPSVAALCDTAAHQAAQETGVPVSVMLAITRAETGRSLSGTLSPWPWAINRAGRGAWFPSQDEAIDAVARAIAGGERNIDIGCFQINLHWHGKAFRSLEEMFDPARNARYAAKFLSSLHVETGDWSAAIGAYHSRREDDATRYLARVEDLMARSIPAVSYAVPPQAPVKDTPRATRVNRFPLLQGGQPGALGSLVSSPDDAPISPLIR